jgi:hypothetical protein
MQLILVNIGQNVASMMMCECMRLSVKLNSWCTSAVNNHFQSALLDDQWLCVLMYFTRETMVCEKVSRK